MPPTAQVTAILHVKTTTWWKREEPLNPLLQATVFSPVARYCFQAHTTACSPLTHVMAYNNHGCANIYQDLSWKGKNLGGGGMAQTLNVAFIIHSFTTWFNFKVLLPHVFYVPSLSIFKKPRIWYRGIFRVLIETGMEFHFEAAAAGFWTLVCGSNLIRKEATPATWLRALY